MERLSTSGVKPAFGNVPDGIEVCPRYGAQGAVFVVINFSKQAQTIQLPRSMTDVLEGGEKQSVNLPVYGVAVLAAKQ